MIFRPTPFYDGDFTKLRQCGPVIPVRAEDTDSLMFHVPVNIRSAYYHKVARGSQLNGVPGFVVGETTPRCVGGDVLEYELITASVPATRTVPVPYVYPFQIIISTTHGMVGDSDASYTQSIVEIPVPVTAHRTYRYYHTTNPSGIALNHAYRGVQGGDFVYLIGTAPKPGAASILAEDDQIERWHGNIWEVTSTKVDVHDIVKSKKE